MRQRRRASKSAPADETYLGDFGSIVRQVAAFSDITYSVTDAIDLTFGGRESAREYASGHRATIKFPLYKSARRDRPNP